MTRLPDLTRRYGFDALVVIAVVVGALDLAIRSDAARAPQTTLWTVVPALALVVLPLLARRRFPFAAPAALWLLAAAASFVDGRLIIFAVSATVAGLAAAFLLGNLPDPVQARIGLVIVLAGASTIVYNDPNHGPGDFVFVPILFTIGWLAGYAMRERAVQAQAAEVRAAVAEREREATARLAVAEERTRIARELHDIVAHAVSVMVLQVGAVRHRLPAQLHEDADALKDVEQAGRSALAEMRRLLGALRSDGEAAALAPEPGLDRLDALLAEVGRAGLPVQLMIDGEPCPLPRAIDLSAYRIVQEGLTNVLKHAHASRAEVTLRYGPDDLRIDVHDDGAGTATSNGSGHGLVGIRERVKIYRGEMSAGTAEDGGFLLRTRLPLRDAS
ncbi:sensor histidine kinase [Nocardioides guangzhouensis]|uniref:histidine kinase n=1 Tax=Nocardioides guangzhouensis TaxID=2497878 RepID=A0A4Q4Z4F4_9ACTN|nr:sensor histidine kinase [Nocardioides guangzhouensis]RYP81846.1 sensor histidine kinase [Nocardioides guangzhouensis]